MVEWRRISGRKKTGGINNAVNRKTKSLSDRGGTFSRTVVDEKDSNYKVRGRGANVKVKLAKVTTVSISDKGVAKKAKIIKVLENNANKHYVRQKLVTKGAIVSAMLDGKEVKAKVTSRPGQSGVVSATLVK